MPPQLQCGRDKQVWSMCERMATYVCRHQCVAGRTHMIASAYVRFHRRFPRLSLTKHCIGQIQPKMLTKHVLRLIEKFNIDQGLWLGMCGCWCMGVHLRQKWLWSRLIFDTGLCPNALHKRRLDSLRFLMYKRFVEVSDVAGFLFYLNIISVPGISDRLLISHLHVFS